MALPWLIGAAAVAAVSAVAAALSDDSSSSTSYSDNEAEERRRAERERRLRQLKEKREALEASYNERLELDSKKMLSLLSPIAKIDDAEQSGAIIDNASSFEKHTAVANIATSGGLSLALGLTPVVQSRSATKKFINIEMNPDGSDKYVLTRQIIKDKSTLDEFHSNVVFFEQLYSGYVEPKAEVMQISEAIDSLEKQAKKIDRLIKELG